MKLNYVVDENDIKTMRGLEETAANSPDPRIVLDIQQKLAQALQPQANPQLGSDTLQQASAGWGKADNG